MKRRLRDVPWALAMLLPSLGLVAVWTVYPLVKAIQNGQRKSAKNRKNGRISR